MNLILGAGIAGLGAGYVLKRTGIPTIIVEKDVTYGGLCGNFEVGEFRFDRFVHFSFSQNKQVNKLFSPIAGVIKHIPNPYNIYKKHWIKHPAQNNIYTLSIDEKKQIIEDFKKRPQSVDMNGICSCLLYTSPSPRD